MPDSFSVAAALVYSGPADLSASSAPVVRDTLLLVEDDDMVAQLLMQVFRRIRWRVLRASDGAESRYLLEQNHPTIALALVDYGLPDGDGAALCQRLRAIRPGLPVLLTSGRSQSSIIQGLAADGPAAFLAKPFLPSDVLREVQDLVARAA